MDAERPAPAQLAKGALRRLAMSKREPTPANFARAYAEEAGEPPARRGPAACSAHGRWSTAWWPAPATTPACAPTLAGRADGRPRYEDLQRALDRGAAAAQGQGAAWAQLIDRLAKGLERGARHWTAARKKDSLQRVLDGSRSDAQRLQHRLKQLVGAWESDQPDEDVDARWSRPTTRLWPPLASAAPASEATTPATVMPAAAPPVADAQPRITQTLQATVRAGLPADEPRAAELADELAALADPGGAAWRHAHAGRCGGRRLPPRAAPLRPAARAGGLNCWRCAIR